MQIGGGKKNRVEELVQNTKKNLFIYFSYWVLSLKKKKISFCSKLKSQVSQAYFPFCYYDNDFLPQSLSPFRTHTFMPWIRTLKEKDVYFLGFTNNNCQNSPNATQKKSRKFTSACYCFFFASLMVWYFSSICPKNTKKYQRIWSI